MNSNPHLCEFWFLTELGAWFHWNVLIENKLWGFASQWRTFDSMLEFSPPMSCTVLWTSLNLSAYCCAGSARDKRRKNAWAGISENIYLLKKFWGKPQTTIQSPPKNNCNKNKQQTNQTKKPTKQPNKKTPKHNKKPQTKPKQTKTKK